MKKPRTEKTEGKKSGEGKEYGLLIEMESRVFATQYPYRYQIKAVFELPMPNNNIPHYLSNSPMNTLIAAHPAAWVFYP
jgi:hypothetical protein